VYQCKYCKEEAEKGVVIETRTRNTLVVQYSCERCRDKAEKEMEVLNGKKS
jgi:hypothetical protein